MHSVRSIPYRVARLFFVKKQQHTYLYIVFTYFGTGIGDEGVVLLGIRVSLRLQHIQITTSIWEQVGIGGVLREGTWRKLHQSF